jgi:hypothetical protein
LKAEIPAALAPRTRPAAVSTIGPATASAICSSQMPENAQSKVEHHWSTAESAANLQQICSEQLIDFSCK